MFPEFCKQHIFLKGYFVAYDNIHSLPQPQMYGVFLCGGRNVKMYAENVFGLTVWLLIMMIMAW